MAEQLIHRVVFPAGFELPAPRSEIDPLYFHTEDGDPSEIEVLDRVTVRLEKGQTLDTDTYFNRLPAGYWQRWTRVQEVELSASGSGRARVAIRRSFVNGAASTLRVIEAELSDGVRWPVDLSVFAAGGNLWVEVEALDDEVIVKDVRWQWHTDEDLDLTTDIAITTFDRPLDVFALLNSLRMDPETLAVVGDVWLIDNGTKRFTEVEGADDLVTAWGADLHHVQQPNLGGSGGFARGMWEATTNSDSPYLMLLDDDIVVEPESIRRAVVMAETAKQPVVVGLQMLSRAEPTVLNSLAEWVDTKSMMWGPAPGSHEQFDLVEYNVHAEPRKGKKGEKKQISTRIEDVLDAGYNGWWACLIPTEGIRKAGLPLPFFIKWDDAEYAYRLARHGIRTVTMMGSAVWHEPWTLKEDSTDWTLYFHVRNRLIFAAMMSAGMPKRVRKRRVDALVRDIFMRDVMRNVLRRAYASAATADMAMRDFLKGPDQLTAPLNEVVVAVRQSRKGFPDAEMEVPTGGSQGVPRTHFRRQPKVPIGLPRSFMREFGIPVPRIPVPVPPSWLDKDQGDAWRIWQLADDDGGPAELQKVADHWWGMLDEPDAWVATVDGAKATRRTRRPDLARALTRQAWRTGREVKEHFAELSEAYSGAVPELTSPQAWARQFGIEVER